MRIKPYRVCDICGMEYNKTHGALKVKWRCDPVGMGDFYGEIPIMERMDIRPKCSKLMLNWIQEHTERGE